MIRHVLAGGLTALIGLAGAYPAAAQIRGNVSVPISIRFEIAPDPPLEFRIVRPLSFGTVMIPNRVRENTVCSYRLRTSGVVQIQDDIRSPVDPARGTYTGCQVVGPVSPGRVALRCAAGARLSATVFTRNAGLADIRFVESTQIEGQADQFGRGSISMLCAPNAQGEMFILLGGFLDVGTNYTIPTGQQVEVATVIFDAVYT